MQSLIVIERFLKYVRRYNLGGNHRYCAARDSGIDFVYGICNPAISVQALEYFKTEEESMQKTYSESKYLAVRRPHRCYEQLMLATQAKEPALKDLTPLQQVKVLHVHIGNDSSFDWPVMESGVVNLSKIHGGWRRLRRRMFRGDRGHPESRQQFLLNVPKKVMRRRVEE